MVWGRRCPSQISRFLPSIGNYIYGTSSDAVWVNLYIGSDAKFKVDGKDIELKQVTDYPWDGAVTLTVSTPSALKKEIRLRLPEWCGSYSISVNGTPTEAPVEKGYAVLGGEWKQGDAITLNMEMPVEMVAADPHVTADAGKRAIQRGPLVYCMEEVDNPGDFDTMSISAATSFEEHFDASLLNGVVGITAGNGDKPLTLIPYYAWDNREAGKMKVWIEYNE